MHPDLLLRPRRVAANTQDILHLLIAGVQHTPGNIEANALSARRASQATTVGPELAEHVDLAEQLADVEHGRGNGLGRLAVGDQGCGDALEESRLGVARVDADGEDGALAAGGGAEDEMQLGLGPVVLDCVVGRRVDVPALEIHRFGGHVAVFLEADRDRARGPCVCGGQVDVEGRAVAPI